MPGFTSFSDTLPDPINRIGWAGNPDDVGGQYGPGFSSYKLKQVRPTMQSMFNSSSRYASESVEGHWEIDVTYNKLPREEFNVLFAFLGLKRQSLEPFYIELPEFSSQTTTSKTTSSLSDQGTSLLVTDGNGSPVVAQPRQIFTLDDPLYTGVYITTAGS